MREGAQAHILQKNELALFSPCGCHSLNLCGVHAAESCPAVITFFGTIQKLFNIFSASPQRWDILQKHVGCSLHSMSQTRWSARVACVRPFAGHASGLRDAINDLFHLNLTPETRSTLNGIKTYLGTFKFILLAST